jgi:Protein of unknown function (DUF3159)
MRRPAATMHAMPGNPLPEGAAPTSTNADPLDADGVLGALAGDVAADLGDRAARAAEAAVPEPRGAAGADGSEVGEGGADEDDETVRAAAYQASVMAVYGGRRGLAEIGLPTMVFVGVYTATTRLTLSLWCAVAVSAVLGVWRLVKREKVQNAISGVLGVVVCALFARHTGQAKDFYLPGVLLNVGEALLFGISALVRWPIVGVVLGPITGEMMAWRVHPARLRAFMRATLLLAAMFVFRVLVEVPLYLSNQTTALGAAKVLLGYPLYLMIAFLCWQIIRKAPPPVRAEAEA